MGPLPLRGLLRRFDAAAIVVEEAIESRDDHKREQGGSNEAADDDDRERALNLGARTGGEEEGNEAEGGDGRRHHDGAEPLKSALDDGLPLSDAGLAQFANVADEERH